jgi:2-dehydro-3-deoxygalactonokinase
MPAHAMTSAAAFIAGDWGTSHLRLALCGADGQVLELRQGPGAAESRGKFAESLDALCADWRAAHGELPVLLCGMVGSAFGWREAPYLACPAQTHELADALVSPRADVQIVPGMKCTNPLGAPDVMRGEETQLLGAATGSLAPGIDAGKTLVCMPGTHTKWVSMYDGVVQEFLTAPTGELFALLSNHSVIVRDATTLAVHRAAEFERGLAEARRHPEIPVLHKIFQARTLRLDQQLAPEGAASWMSGLLIGTDVAGALQLLEAAGPGAAIHVIGATGLVHAYATALAAFGRRAVAVDGGAAAFAGLAYLHRELDRRK